MIMDENAKKMATLLRQGYTMLNQSCPICNNPIFRDKNSENFCPICNRKVVIVEGSTNKEITNTNPQNTSPEFKISNPSLVLVGKTLSEKMEWICQKLKEETQIDTIEKYSIILKNFIKLIKEISKIPKS